MHTYKRRQWKQARFSGQKDKKTKIFSAYYLKFIKTHFKTKTPSMQDPSPSSTIVNSINRIDCVTWFCNDNMKYLEEVATGLPCWSFAMPNFLDFGKVQSRLVWKSYLSSTICLMLVAFVGLLQRKQYGNNVLLELSYLIIYFRISLICKQDGTTSYDSIFYNVHRRKLFA